MIVSGKNERITVALFRYWCVKILDEVVDIRKDNRFTGHLATWQESSPIRVTYNARNLAKWSVGEIISGVFHEIRHIQQGKDNPYETDLEIILSEHDAESFAVEMIKKHYPDRLNEAIEGTKKSMNNARWRGMFPNHFIAYSQIEEYGE